MVVLVCGVCLTLPSVHQCNEGHCYCVKCWRALDPRHCPEHRQPIPDSCRNRDREATIAALKATCEHCAEVTTRGAVAAHQRACPQRPTACTGAYAGCGWSGVAAEREAHEAACKAAGCLRLMALLHQQNQQLQAKVAVLKPQNQELRAQMTALEPLVRALEGPEGGAEEGGRRQRQRVGAAPHNAPPSSAAVEQMGVAEAMVAVATEAEATVVAGKVVG